MDTAASMSIGNALLALIVAGLLGMVGQGIRAIAGIKKMADDAQAKGISPSAAFSPSWFFVSLMIGFIAGVVAGLALGLSKILKAPDDFQMLPGIAGAGYTGADFVEAFASRYSSGLMPKALPSGAIGAGAAAPQNNPGTPSYPA
jgi:putative chitinase